MPYFRDFSIGLLMGLTAGPIASCSLASAAFATPPAKEIPLTLEAALKRAAASNPEILAYQSQLEGERALIGAQYAPEKLKLGIVREAAMTNFELQGGPMTSWTLSQEFKFPTKYSLMASAQRSKSESVEQQAEDKKLEVRKKVLSAYFGLYTADRILALLQAQKETLREIAHIAETRHTVGTVPQQDEMKAHLEQTKIENDLLMVKQERDAAEANLNGVLDQDSNASILLPTQLALSVPVLKVPIDQIEIMAHTSAKHIKHGQFMVAEADAKLKLARMDYAPDFGINFRKAFLNSAPGNYAIGLEMTLPLWFFLKQSNEVSAASAGHAQAEHELNGTTRSLHSQIRAMATKAEANRKVLQIYEAALIPQASSTLNSSRSAYQAGRSPFTDLLDSERSLYEIRITFFRTLTQYIDNLAELEQMVGASLSSLPFGETL